MCTEILTSYNTALCKLSLSFGALRFHLVCWGGRCRLQAAGSRLQAAGSRLQAAGSRQQTAGSKKKTSQKMASLSQFLSQSL